MYTYIYICRPEGHYIRNKTLKLAIEVVPLPRRLFRSSCSGALQKMSVVRRRIKLEG